jgi:hypothetical protein
MLLIRPYPKATDSLPSYLLRLTAANGYKNSMQLLRAGNCSLSNNRLPGKKIFFGYFDLERVAMLANIDISQVDALKFRQVSNTRCSAFAQDFLVKNLNVSQLRVCPHCYGEHSTIAFTNSLAAKTYCTKHNCPLITVHPVTGRKLTWATHYLWRDITSWNSDISSVEIMEAEFQINQQIESLEVSHLIIGGLSFNLAEYCDLLEFFAHFHHFALGNKNSIHAKNNIEFSRQYHSAAYWYIAEWPARFFQLLEHFEGNPMSGNRLTGIRKCFRDLYDDINSPENSRSKAYELLKIGFTEYLCDHFSNGMLMRTILLVDPKAKEQSTFISDTQVARVLCCPLSKVKVYIREKLISPSHFLVNGTRLFLRTGVMRLKSKLENCCSIDECAELLDVSVYHTRQLLRDGIINPLLEPNLTSRDWLIEKREIERLINRLKANALPSVCNPTTAIKRFGFAGYSFTDLIKKMLSGQVNYSYSDSNNAPFSLIKFTPIYQANDDVSTELLTPQEACSALGINKNVIYEFIKIGLVDCIKQKTNRTPRPIKLIPKESINKFKTCYLLRHQLNGIPVSDLKIISGPKIDGGLVNVYQRKEY